MKKTTLLNAALSAAVARTGHGDMIVIADAGLPVPEGRVCIDLALSPGVAGFLQALRVVVSELYVERAIAATNLTSTNPALRSELGAALPGVPVDEVSHEALKTLCRSAVSIVRTGEFTSYANVVLVSGVAF
jgi:D-ribose pyranase